MICGLSNKYKSRIGIRIRINWGFETRLRLIKINENALVDCLFVYSVVKCSSTPKWSRKVVVSGIKIIVG